MLLAWMGEDMEAKLGQFADLSDDSVVQDPSSSLKWLVGVQSALGNLKEGSANLQLCKRLGIHRMKNAVKLACVELFRLWKGVEDESEEENEGEDDDDAQTRKMETTDLEQERKEVQKHIANFHNLGWVKLYSREMMEAVHEEIGKHVKRECRGEFEEKLIPGLQQWLQDTMLPFAKMLKYSPVMSESDELVNASTLEAMLESEEERERLEHSLWPTLAMSALRNFSLLRATELSDIIMEFPDSMVAVKELRDAITASDTLGEVGKIFRPIISRRLLHVGASTSQILDMYVSMIKTLRVVDGSDLLLNYVTLPVRAYLLSRKDTVRCVVQALHEGKGSDLHGELRRGRSLEYGPDEDDEDGGAGADWNPRKRQLDLQVSGEKGRGLDILALLISIYGSTDLFVKDYRTVLADKLISNLSYRADQEVATLELLKIRFGEAALHGCEVMLKDLEDSRRLNIALTRAMEKEKDKDMHVASNGYDQQDCWVDCAVVSDFYWPSFSPDEFKLHPSVEIQMSRYCDTYADVKKPRKLTLVPNSGVVHLELDFDDGSTRSFACSPLQATVIMNIADAAQDGTGVGEGVAAEAIALACELDEEELGAPLSYWIGRGVIKTHRDPSGQTRYSVIEDQAERAALDARRKVKEQATGGETQEDGGAGGSDGDSDDADDSALMDEDDGNDAHDQQLAASAMAAAADKNALALYKQYVVNIVTSHGSMSLDRIHTMLKLLASGDGGGDKFDMNVLQLKRFLQTLVEADTLVDDDGTYSLHK